MKYCKLIFILIITFVIQITIVPNLSIRSSYPNLILIGLIILVLNSKFYQGLIWAGIGGIFLDIFSSLHFGFFTITLLLIYVLFYIILKKFISHPVIFIVVAVFVISSLLFDLLPYILIGKNILIYIYNIVYNTFLGTVIYYLTIEKFKNKFSTYKLSIK